MLGACLDTLKLFNTIRSLPIKGQNKTFRAIVGAGEPCEPASHLLESSITSAPLRYIHEHLIQQQHQRQQQAEHLIQYAEARLHDLRY